MVPFDRILLALYSLFFTVLFILFSAVMLGWPVPLFLLKDIFYPGRPEIFWPLMLILILAGGRLFWSSLHKPRGKHVVLTESALGQIKVSLHALEDLVEKVAAQINGVREVSSQMFAVPEGVGIKIKASVTPDINVPAVSAEVQNLVKERVFEVTGLSVNTIKVTIESISAKKPRVE